MKDRSLLSGSMQKNPTVRSDARGGRVALAAVVILASLSIALAAALAFEPAWMESWYP